MGASLRHKLGFEVATKAANCYFIDELPVYIHWRLALYLSPYDLHTKLKPLNRYFRQLIS
jgi:hypothetical protein